MRGVWDFYMCPVDNHLSSIALDMGVAEELPLEKMDWLVAVSVELQNPNEGGFCSPEEYPVLTEIEEHLTLGLVKTLGGIQVGRVTGGSTRDFLFYLPTTSGVSEQVEEAMQSFTHTYKIHQQEETKWQTYWEFLYPNPWQVKTIQNRHLIEELVNQGDDSIQIRPVDHYAYFESEDQAKEYADQVKSWDEEGWKVEAISQGEGEESAWAVHVISQQATDLITVNQKSAKLFEAAYHIGGEYDGWGTVICLSPKSVN